MGRRLDFTYIANESGYPKPDSLYAGDKYSYIQTSTAEFGSPVNGGLTSAAIVSLGFNDGWQTEINSSREQFTSNDTAVAANSESEYRLERSGDSTSKSSSYSSYRNVKQTGGITTHTFTFTASGTTEFAEDSYSLNVKSGSTEQIQSGGIYTATGSGSSEENLTLSIHSKENAKQGGSFFSGYTEYEKRSFTTQFETYDTDNNESGTESKLYKTDNYLVSRVNSSGGYNYTTLYSARIVTAEPTGDAGSAIWTIQSSSAQIDEDNTVGGTTYAQSIYFENATTTYQTTYGNATLNTLSQSAGDTGESYTRDVGSDQSIPPINDLPSWVTIQSTSDGFTNILTVTIAPNTETDDREATAIFGGVNNSGTTNEIIETLSSNEFIKQVGASTFDAITTGTTTRAANQSTTSTKNSTLGVFFSETITRLSTYYLRTDTIEQTRDSKILSKSGGYDSFNDPRSLVNSGRIFITDRTYSAKGGVLGWISNNQIKISGTITTSYLLNDAVPSYNFDGASESYKFEEHSFSRGSGDSTDTSIPRYSFTVTNPATESTISSTVADFELVSEDYTYYQRTNGDGTRPFSFGWLGQTQPRLEISTTSREIIWQSTSERPLESPSTSTELVEFNTIGRLIFTTTNNIGATYDNIRILKGKSSIETYNATSFTEVSTTVTQFLPFALNIRNFTIRQEFPVLDRSAFDSPRVSPNLAQLLSYKSHDEYYKNGMPEVAFATETATNRESRDKLSPPEIRYTEWYLASSVVSDDVTINTKSSRTDSSYYIPDAGFPDETSALNNLFYFPKDDNVEIVDNKTNSMSFDDDGDITQIAKGHLTWTTDTDDLVRSTSSKFLKILELKGGLIKLTNPKSYLEDGARSGRYQYVFGGNNEYDENGTILLKGDASVTVFDQSNGSTILEQSLAASEADKTYTLAKGKGMLSLSAPEKRVLVPFVYKNQPLQTSRNSPGFLVPSFTSPTGSYGSSSYYSYYYYY